MAIRGRCLNSQEIDALVSRGVLAGRFHRAQTQPSSFEPVIGNECYILDAEEGLFRPRADKSVMRSLLELPKRKRQKVDISEGFEIKQGSSYLFPLEWRIKVGREINFIKSSPKSSIGRVFPSTRLLTDYNSSFDEITNFPRNTPLKSWLLVQPLAFNLIVGPGLSFNQLRFFKGYDAQLTSSEISMEWKRNPLLYSKNLEGKLGDPIGLQISENLQLHLDLEGLDSHGIVALRARANPNPIDLRKKEGYCAENYFEPLKPENSSLIIKPGEHYLVASKEVLKIPAHLNAELKAHSHQGIMGTLHRAGFVDNGFCGDLVFEVTSEEPTDVHLIDGMPIGELVVYRTKKPDKIYGAEIGSHYVMQTGPKVAKYFAPFDFASAAKDHARLNRDVLVQDKGLISKLHLGEEPFALVKGDRRVEEIFKTVEEGFFHSRYDCEGDDLVLQPVPYIVVFDERGRVFSYVRSNKGDNLGDVRLHGRSSIGVGGHIRREDVPDYVRNCVNREVNKDIYVDGGLSRPKFLGTLYCHGEDVDDHHFGLVFSTVAKGRVSAKDSAIVSSQMVSISSIKESTQNPYEDWSRVLIPHLGEIYQESRK